MATANKPKLLHTIAAGDMGKSRQAKRRERFEKALGGRTDGWDVVQTEVYSDYVRCQVSGLRMKTGVRIRHKDGTELLVGIGVAQKYANVKI